MMACPLNIGAFPRIAGKEVIFDGIKPNLPLHQMIELQRNGSGALKKYISEHCTWISEVREYDITHASGSFFHKCIYRIWRSTGYFRH